MEKTCGSCHLETIARSTLKRCRWYEFENARIRPYTLPFDFWRDREGAWECVTLREIRHAYHRHIEYNGDILTQGIEISFWKYALNHSTRKCCECTHLIFPKFFPIFPLN